MAVFHHCASELVRPNRLAVSSDQLVEVELIDVELVKLNCLFVLLNHFESRGGYCVIVKPFLGKHQGKQHCEEHARFDRS
jgi:hypothetical protein